MIVGFEPTNHPRAQITRRKGRSKRTNYRSKGADNRSSGTQNRSKGTQTRSSGTDNRSQGRRPSGSKSMSSKLFGATAFFGGVDGAGVPCATDAGPTGTPELRCDSARCSVSWCFGCSCVEGPGSRATDVDISRLGGRCQWSRRACRTSRRTLGVLQGVLVAGLQTVLLAVQAVF